MTGPSGTRQFLNILSWDEKAKAYTEYSVSSFGESEYDQGGSLSGDTLTFLVEQDAGGKPAKFRYAETHASTKRMTYKAEVSVAGAPWSLLAEGVIERVHQLRRSMRGACGNSASCWRRSRAGRGSSSPASAG